MCDCKGLTDRGLCFTTKEFRRLLPLTETVQLVSASSLFATEEMTAFLCSSFASLVALFFYLMS